MPSAASSSHDQPLSSTASQLLREACWIGGRWVATDARFAVRDPATGAVLAECSDAGSDLAEAAVLAAHEAFEGWRRTPARQRSNVLSRWRELILEHADGLAELMTAEQGKPLPEARGEVSYGASFVQWFAEEAPRVYGEVVPTHAADRRLLTLRQPVGVVSVITPWNFPIAMITRKVAPALAAGCTVVIKPAEDTPLCALALAELAARAGFPAGVLNVVTAGDPRQVGEVLTTHPLVRKVTFTGSTAVGKLLLAQAAGTVKRTSMELGGNAPLIVFDDADLERAVEGALASKFRNGGQTCICANRLLVQAGIHDRFVERFRERSAELVVGPGSDPGTSIGPMIHAAAVERLRELVEEATGQGARCWTGPQGEIGGGCFFPVTILTEAEPRMRVFQEEIFGPVAPILRFEEESDAIQLANATDYGLAAYLFTSDAARQWRVAEELEFGLVGVNEVAISAESVPFGGMKQSGIGREGSRHGIDEYVEIKYLCLGGMDTPPTPS